MTNFEYYGKQIKELASIGRTYAFTVGYELKDCDEIDCKQCQFSYHNTSNEDDNCSSEAVLWLYKEYEPKPIDWSAVEIDTKVMAATPGDSKCYRYHFAGIDKEGNPMVWSAGGTSWSTFIKKDAVKIMLPEGELDD